MTVLTELSASVAGNIFDAQDANEVQFLKPIQRIHPTSKSPESSSIPSGKNILISRNVKSVYILPVSPDEGRVAVVTNARWDAVDAEIATDERNSSGRQSRVVLTPQGWRQVRGKQNFSLTTVTNKS